MGRGIFSHVISVKIGVRYGVIPASRSVIPVKTGIQYPVIPTGSVSPAYRQAGDGGAEGSAFLLQRYIGREIKTTERVNALRLFYCCLSLRRRLIFRIPLCSDEGS